MPRGTPIRVVVVVDDYEPLRRILTEEAEARGCDVVGEAGNGREALEVVERVAADVVVMDFSMPVMDGLAAAAAIHDRFPAVEIVAFTSSDCRALAEAMLEAGASAHFVKPDVGGLLDYVARR
jgi:CheY-like chemotaxis protein